MVKDFIINTKKNLRNKKIINIKDVYKNQSKLKIFGPFSKAKDVRKTIDVLNKLLPYCTTHVKRCVKDLFICVILK